MSFANVQFPFYQVILYLLTFWNCESNTFRSSNVWPRLQILWWEFVWKEEFSRWLRCRLSFGPRPPLTNLKFPRLFSANHPPLSFEHVPPWWAILWFTRWWLSRKKSKKEIFVRRCQVKKWFQNSDPAGRLSPTVIRNRWRRPALPVDWTTIALAYNTLLYWLDNTISQVVYLCADWTSCIIRSSYYL